MTQSGDLSERLAKLSPEKRKLLLRLTERKQKSRVDEAAEAAPISEQRFNFTGDMLSDKDDVRRWYDSVSRQLNDGPFADFSLFLNYGYVPNDQPQHAVVQLPPKQLNKNTIRLVLELISDTELSPETRFLDVGCGRGGTVTVLRTFFDVGPVTGLDLAPSAVEFNRKTHTWPHTEFLVGDAENLPFDDASFDVVSNVESSHCYGNIEDFYRGVHRVLAPGGAFLYTDLIGADVLAVREGFLEDLGFALEQRRDISSNVLLSCDETAARNAKAFSANNDGKLIDGFLGVPNTGLYDAMKNGVQRYMMYRFRKEPHVG